MRYTSAVTRCFHYARVRSSRSIRIAIEDFQPLILVAGDDHAAYALYSLYERCRREDDARSQMVANLIEESLGDPAFFAMARRKSEFIRMARELGVRIPETLDIGDKSVLRACCDEIGFPLALKQDGTSAGRGVAIARSREEAEAGYRHLRAERLVDVGRELLDGLNVDAALELMRGGPSIVVQRYVAGRPANCAVLCHRGQLLASVSFLTVEAHPSPTGPSTVLQRMEHHEIDETVRRVVARLGLSGFCGFDFLVDQDNRAFLLELNPRITAASALGEGPTGDLCGALFRMLAGRPGFPPDADLPDPPSLKAPHDQLIALFPGEWQRCRDSPHLPTSYHRVPWHDPELVRYLAAQAYAAERLTPRQIIKLLARWVVTRINRDAG